MMGMMGPMYREASLRYIVKAEDAASAAQTAGKYTAESVNPCGGEGMEGCYEVCLKLEPADLESMLGKPKGADFRAAARMALKAAKMSETDSD